MVGGQYTVDYESMNLEYNDWNDRIKGNSNIY